MHRSDGMAACEESPVPPALNVGLPGHNVVQLVSESLAHVAAMPAGAAAAPVPDGAAAAVEEEEDEEVISFQGGPWDAADETGACLLLFPRLRVGPRATSTPVPEDVEGISLEVQLDATVPSLFSATARLAL